MDVHIDLSRIDFEVQPIGGIRFPGKEGLKGIRDRMVEVTVLDETTVDKEILLSAGLTRKLGLTNKTLNVQKGGLLLNRYQAFVIGLPVEVDNPLSKIGCGKLEDFQTILVQ